jgi:hypothetical protein
MLTKTTKVVYISVCTCVLKLTRPILLAINRENAVFAIGALMFAEKDAYMIMKCLIVTKWVVKLWSGRDEKLVSGNRMVDEPKEVAAVIILRIIYNSEEKRTTILSVFGLGSGY